MGDVSAADPSTIPYPVPDPRETWHRSEGYKHNPGNYMLLIENFLNLTHLHFLHGAEISDLSQADNPPKSLKHPGTAVGWIKENPGAPAGLVASIFGDDPAELVRIIDSDSQFGPSLNYGYSDRYPLSSASSSLYPLRFHVIHGVTPEDIDNTHQFFQFSFNRELSGGLESFRDFNRDVVFEQDVVAIRYMQEHISADRRESGYEYGIPSDRFGISMRRMLRRMAAGVAGE